MNSDKPTLSDPVIAALPAEFQRAVENFCFSHKMTPAQVFMAGYAMLNVVRYMDTDNKGLVNAFQATELYHAVRKAMGWEKQSILDKVAALRVGNEDSDLSF